MLDSQLETKPKQQTLPPLDINVTCLNQILNVGKWNDIIVTVKNQSLTSRHISINLNTSYDQEMVWKSATSKQKHRILKDKSIIESFQCMPLAPIDKLYLNEYFSVLDFTKSIGFTYNLQEETSECPGISAI